MKKPAKQAFSRIIHSPNSRNGLWDYTEFFSGNTGARYAESVFITSQQVDKAPESVFITSQGGDLVPEKCFYCLTWGLFGTEKCFYQLKGGR